jgi:hypothetical protein
METKEVPQGNVGEPVGKVKAPRRSPQDQDQEIQNFINEARQRIQQARETPETQARLATLGFSATRLADGATLAEAAVTAFAARQRALGEAEQGVAEARAAGTRLVAGFVHFRQAVRIATSDNAIQAGLGVTGRLPKDTEKFLTAVQASLQTAQHPSYAPLVASVGYDAPALAALAAVGEGFAAARRSSTEAQAHARATTADRNAAVKALRTFTSPFYRALRLL